MSDLEDIEFNWRDPAVDMDSVCRPGIDTQFSPFMFDNFQLGSTTANSIIVDDEETKENSAPTTLKSESAPPTEPPDYWEVVHLGID